MENITLFASIAIIVFGVLQIILFFKLWEMTNDVKKISLKHSPSKEDELIDEAKLLCLDGEKENAFKCYKQAFFISISELYNNISQKYNVALKEDRKEIWESNYPNIVRFFSKRMIPTGFSLNFEEYDSFDKVDKILSGNN